MRDEAALTVAELEAAAASILVVCTGNICRSPAAVALLRRRLDSSIKIASAGTRALEGASMPAFMVSLVEEADASPPAEPPRLLTKSMIEAATVVLAMATHHRTVIVRLSPPAVQKTFTFLEVVRLGSTLVPEDLSNDRGSAGRLHDLPRAAQRQRALSLGHQSADDVPDPFGKREAVYRKSFGMIDEAADRLAALLAPR